MTSLRPKATNPSKVLTLRNGEIKFLIMVFLVLILSPAVLPSVTAQPTTNTNNNNDNPNNGYPYAKFSPSMAIIIVVLVAALFFMGFFSIYIRHCSDSSGSSVRNALSMHARRGNTARGLDASVIETFPTFSYAEVKDHKIGKGALECAVCLNEFEEDETLRLIPKCDHVFHPECIDAWLESHVTCPVCRANLVPQPDDQSYHLPDTNQETQENSNDDNSEPPRNDVITIQVSDDHNREPNQEQDADKPRVTRNISFNFPNRPPRTESVRRGRTFGLARFRSHSTGHSLVQPGENVDRFTLRLPDGIRKEMMNRALLNRTKSSAMGLPRAASSRRGFRAAGVNEESSRNGRSYSRIERSDRAAKSDRWLFSKAPPFFSRALSIRSPRVVADSGEGSTSKSVKNTVKMPSFKCLEPKSADEAVLVHSDSVRPPV